MVVNDHPVTREGLIAALGSSAELQVVAGVGSGDEAISAVREMRIDVMFLDVRMPGMGGIEAARLIRRSGPGTRIVMLTVDDSRATLAEAMRAGVAGYLLKEVEADELIRAARLIRRARASSIQR